LNETGCSESPIATCARSPEHGRSEVERATLEQRWDYRVEISLDKRKAPRSGPSSAQKVLSERRSSRGGREQLPVLRQNYLIDCMNDAVRRDEIRLRDADSINPYV
jgi:hypothetical protein